MRDTKFNPHSLQHRMQMLQLIHALSLEIKTGMRHSKINFFAHAKALGWIPQGTRTKRAGLALLCNQATRGFGYVVKPHIKASFPIVKPAKKAKVSA